ncbi:hypothetical protein J6590_036760 [Homalodisca vitripennis]|nr:hypothetical protein J6590_036760 [Homalodisca vitripennis]
MAISNSPSRADASVSDGRYPHAHTRTHEQLTCLAGETMGRRPGRTVGGRRRRLWPARAESKVAVCS